MISLLSHTPETYLSLVSLESTVLRATFTVEHPRAVVTLGQQLIYLKTISASFSSSSLDRMPLAMKNANTPLKAEISKLGINWHNMKAPGSKCSRMVQCGRLVNSKCWWRYWRTQHILVKPEYISTNFKRGIIRTTVQNQISQQNMSTICYKNISTS